VNRDEARQIIGDAIASVAPEADLAAVADDASLRDELDLDSMDFLNVVIDIHRRTGFEVPERDYPLLATLGGFVDYLVRST
jgi:acyl carrier protein